MYTYSKVDDHLLAALQFLVPELLCVGHRVRLRSVLKENPLLHAVLLGYHVHIKSLNC